MKKYKFTLLILALSLSVFAFFSLNNEAPETNVETLHGRINSVQNLPDEIQAINITITKGSLKGDEITIQEDQSYVLNRRDFNKGDRVVIEYNQELEQFILTDFVRSNVLLWLFLIFLALVVLISKWQGVGALLGMLLSFIILFKITLPWIASGGDPITAAIVSSLLIIPATFFSSHGFNKKTLIAAVSTVITLIVAGLLATLFADLANLTGLASEEASFLKLETANNINFQGLILAGMLIGILGVLDDVTVSQASVVRELKAAKQSMSKKELYARAMNVGTDHIASVVNTIILIYAGSALPLLLLFLDHNTAFTNIINIEPIAEEIIRSLIGSIGLILAVPITTALAVFFITGKEKDMGGHHCHHH